MGARPAPAKTEVRACQEPPEGMGVKPASTTMSNMTQPPIGNAFGLAVLSLATLPFILYSMPPELPERRTLPLFPLNTVLFPGASLPLQIFEERYKRLLQDCLDSDSRFGIVLIKSGDEVGQPAIPHPVGTVAHITQVNEIRGDRFFVSVTGERRFKINTITQHRPYINADVSILPDEDNEEARPQAESIRQHLNEYLRLITGLQGGWTGEVHTSREPAALSYYIAETLLIDLSEKQQLLEEPDTASRLGSEAEVLRRDIDHLRQRVTAELRGRFSRQ